MVWLTLLRALLAGRSSGADSSFLVGTDSDRVLGGVRDRPSLNAAVVDRVQCPPRRHQSVAPELMSRINVPMVVVGETTNAASGFGPACAPLEDNFEQYYAAATSPAPKIEVLGIRHMS